MAIPTGDIYEFKTPGEVLEIVQAISTRYPPLEKAEMALTELMINAVEHGNLGITYEEKSALLQSGRIIEEIEKRLRDKKYADRTASIEIKDLGSETVVFIFDDGEGFNWKDYLDRNLSQINGYHGRGIPITLNFCKTLNYIGNGNKVVLVIDNTAD